MTRTLPTAILVLLLSVLLAFLIASIPTMGVAGAQPVADAVTAPSVQMPVQPPAPAVEDLWRRGEYVAAFVVGLFLVCGALLRLDPRRAWIYTAGVTVLGGCVGSIAAGEAPTVSMLVGAGVALAALLMRGPGLPARPPERGRIASRLLIALACLALVLAVALFAGCS